MCKFHSADDDEDEDDDENDDDDDNEDEDDDEEEEDEEELSKLFSELLSLPKHPCPLLFFVA